MALFSEIWTQSATVIGTWILADFLDAQPTKSAKFREKSQNCLGCGRFSEKSWNSRAAEGIAAFPRFFADFLDAQPTKSAKIREKAGFASAAADFAAFLAETRPNHWEELALMTYLFMKSWLWIQKLALELALELALYLFVNKSWLWPIWHYKKIL